MENQMYREAQGSNIYPDVPTANLDVEGRVPMPVLEEIADRHAHEVWGENVRRGKPFPVTDLAGAVHAYVFPYIRGQKQFPTYDALFEDIRVLQARGLKGEGEAAEQARKDWNQFGERFGAIYVSATDKQFPIQLVRHYLHPYFQGGSMAQAEASRHFNRPEVRLERICFVNPHEEYFEFTSGEDRILVDVQSRKPEVTEQALAVKPGGPPSPELQEAIKRVWRLGVENAPLALNSEEAALTHTEKKIVYWELVPPVPHTWWCAPTSYNMVMGFWDQYVPGIGTFMGYGRLISHWFEHSKYCHLPDGWVDVNCTSTNAIPNNVPSITDELIDPNTGTWRAGFNSFEDFVSKMYKYKFTTGGPSDGKGITAANDWAWQDIVKEVNAGRPFFWSFDTHTVVGIGYRIDTNGQKYVIYLDTYGATLQQKLKELSYDTGNGFTWLKPGGGTGNDHGILLAPRGGETVYSSTPSEIRWYVWGVQNKTTNLSFSSDGGKTWTPLATKLTTKAGWNSYLWMPGSVTPKGRIRMQAYVDSEYLVGDGSFENFSTQPQVAGGSWKQIFEPVGMVVAGYDKSKGIRVIYATELATGDIYLFMGKPSGPTNWIKVGGPGKMFVLDSQGLLYGLSPDGSGVYRYTGIPMQWMQIGGPAKEIYGDVDGVCATNPQSGDIYRYLGSPFSWLKVGGPGKTFACDGKGCLYGLSPDGSGVWRYDGLFGPLVQWIKIGGPAANLYARGYGVYATNPQTGDIYFFHGQPLLWTRIGGPGKAFSVDVDGRLYGLSPDGSGVWRYEGSFSAPTKWTKIGGPAANVCAGWREILAINPQTKELWIYIP